MKTHHTQPRKVIAAIHGIITNDGSSAWQSQFEEFCWQKGEPLLVVRREYWEAAVPIFNVYVKNRFLCAPALAAYLLPYCQRGADISFLTHSNGADIGLKTIKLLAAQGFHTRAFVAVAGAIEANVQKNGIDYLIKNGRLGRAVAYCSQSDAVLRPPWIWPYGHLGHIGFQGPHSSRIVTRWFKGYGHGTYWEPGNQEQTFTHAIMDCCHL